MRARSGRRPWRVRRSAAEPRPRARPTTARSNRSCIRRSAPSRAPCRRRNSRGDTTRRPSQLELRGEPPRLGPVARRARGSSARSHSGAKSSARCAGRTRARCSRRVPPVPTRFMPSFQSHEPKSGSPCAPAVVPRSIARTQCSNNVPSSADTLGQSVRLAVRRLRAAAPSERHALVEHAGIARRADVLGNDVRQPQQIVGAASTEAPAGRLVPPVLDVALHELPPRGAKDVLARQVRPRRAAAPSRPATDRGTRTRRRADSSHSRVHSRQLTA